MQSKTKSKLGKSKQATFRLKPETINKLDKLSKRSHINKTAIIEMMIESANESDYQFKGSKK